MKTLIAGAALGALLFGAIPTPAQAEATVEGSAAFEVVGIPNTNEGRIIWSCQARASERVASTGVVCTLSMDGVVIAQSSNTTEGVATATANVTPIDAGHIEVCWEATAVRLDDSIATDSGCES